VYSHAEHGEFGSGDDPSQLIGDVCGDKEFEADVAKYRGDTPNLETRGLGGVSGTAGDGVAIGADKTAGGVNVAAGSDGSDGVAIGADGTAGGDTVAAGSDGSDGVAIGADRTAGGDTVAAGSDGSDGVAIGADGTAGGDTVAAGSDTDELDEDEEKKPRPVVLRLLISAAVERRPSCFKSAYMAEVLSSCFASLSTSAVSVFGMISIDRALFSSLASSCILDHFFLALGA
jgi:hypothetical protein